MILSMLAQCDPGPEDLGTHRTVIAGMLHMLHLHVLHNVALLATVAAVQAGPEGRLPAIGGRPPHLRQDFRLKNGSQVLRFCK